MIFGGIILMWLLIFYLKWKKNNKGLHRQKAYDQVLVLLDKVDGKGFKSREDEETSKDMVTEITDNITAHLWPLETSLRGTHDIPAIENFQRLLGNLEQEWNRGGDSLTLIFQLFATVVPPKDHVVTRKGGGEGQFTPIVHNESTRKAPEFRGAKKATGAPDCAIM
jgi:hypothetical protein